MTDHKENHELKQKNLDEDELRTGWRPELNVLMGHHTEVWGTGSRGGRLKGSAWDEPPTCQGHLTQGEDA